VRLLVAEDNSVLLKALVKALTEAGHKVDSVMNGIDAEVRLRSTSYDVVVLDILLPGRDGMSVLKSLRESGVSTPILLLSSLSAVEDRVEGLTSGADDYLTKPFVFGELLARVDALGRRTSTTLNADDMLYLGAFTLDTRGRRLLGGRKEQIPLRLKEFDLISLLAKRKNSGVTGSEIADQIWGSPLGVTDDVINATVSSLRRKLRTSARAADAPPMKIETVRGVGYVLQVAESD